MTDSPALKALRRRDASAADEAARRLRDVLPVLRCHVTGEMPAAIAVALADLLARVFPRLALDVPDSELDARLRGLLESANPDLEVVDAEAKGPLVSVGEAMPNAVCVDASGWLVNVAPGQHFEPYTERGANPASALLAAALAVAQTVARVEGFLREAPQDGAIKMSLWGPNLEQGPAIPAEIALDTHFFGIGSIAHAALGALALWNSVKGGLVLVDGEEYEDHNQARYAFSAAQVGGAKVVATRAAFARHAGLEVTTCIERIQTWRLRGDLPPRVAVIAPDNREARAWAADTFPRLAVSATADDRVATVTLSALVKGACSYCAYAPPAEDTAKISRIIAEFTGLTENAVVALMDVWKGSAPLPLDAQHVRAMERARGLADGALAHWIGGKLADYLDANRNQLYSAAVLDFPGADRVAFPWPATSAAAGALALAGLLRLGLFGFDPDGQPFNQVWIDIMSGQHGFVPTEPPESGTCLCQHPQRRALLGR